MARILILVLVVLAVFWWLRAKRKPDLKRTQERPPSVPPPRVQNMVACHHCGTHLPETDALQQAGHWYCSPAHRDAAQP